MKVGAFEGKKHTGGEEVPVYSQDESFGEVLISITGKPCTVDEVIWEILEYGDQRAVTEETIFCVIFDMCRYINENMHEIIYIVFKGHYAWTAVNRSGDP